jgi:hypothetical protein
MTARPTGSNQVLATATLEPSSALLVIDSTTPPGSC